MIQPQTNTKRHEKKNNFSHRFTQIDTDKKLDKINWLLSLKNLRVFVQTQSRIISFYFLFRVFSCLFVAKNGEIINGLAG